MRYEILFFKPMCDNNMYETIEINAESDLNAKTKANAKLDAHKRVDNREWMDAKVIKVTRID